MKNDSIIFVGLDTHKTNTEVAYVIDGSENLPQYLGKILTHKQAVSLKYLKSEGLYSLRDGWIKLHYPEGNALYGHV